jgi:YbbR domain-containing protein
MVQQPLYHVKHPVIKKLAYSVFLLSLSYTLWALCNQLFLLTQKLDFPVALYNMHDEFDYQAYPEKVTVTLRGYRSSYEFFDETERAVHIDASQFPEGIYTIFITPEHLFLPPGFDVMQVSPASTTLTITKKSTQEMIPA